MGGGTEEPEDGGEALNGEVEGGSSSRRSGSAAAEKSAREERTDWEVPLIVCGSNTRSQLGVGQGKDVLFTKNATPVKTFERDFKVGALAAGTACTLLTGATTGDLYVCDEESAGEFVPVDTNSIFVQDIAATSTTQFFLSGKRQLYSWGSAKYGQLGRSEQSQAGADKKSPTAWKQQRRKSLGGVKVKPKRVISFGLVEKLEKTRVSQVSAGRFHALALTTAGEVFGWGRNNVGQLGSGDLLDRHTPFSCPFLQGCKVVHIAANGLRSMCCGDSNQARHLLKHVPTKEKFRTAFSWGCAEDKTLGHSRYDGDKESLQKEGDGGLPSIDKHGREVNAYRRKQSIAMILAEQEAMKKEAESKAEYISQNDIKLKVCSTPAPIPAFLQPGRTVEKISLGESHALALLSTGQVLAWGDNTYGQLGLGHSYHETEPCLVENVSNIREVAAGARHSVLVSTQGYVFSFGFNHYGELGLGDTEMRNTPTPLVYLSEEDFKPSGVHCGSSTTSLWRKVRSKETSLCFQEDLRQRECKLRSQEPEGPMVIVERQAEADGYSYIALAGPGTSKGSYTWRVQVDKCGSPESPLGIGVASAEAMDPFMFDKWSQGESWLFMSTGDKQHFGDAESFSEPFYEKDVIEVCIDLDLGVLRFAKRGKDLGICYYLTSTKPLYLCISMASDGDQVTLLPPEEDDACVLEDPGTIICYNDHGIELTTGLEVFYNCGPCKLFICRACARHCKHQKHACQLSINYNPTHQLCECDPKTCQSKKLI